MKTINFLIFFFSVFVIQAKLVDIGLFPAKELSHLKFMAEEGKYLVYTEFGKLAELKQGDQLQISNKEGKILLSKDQVSLGTFEKVNIIGESRQNYFSIDIQEPFQNESQYDDNLKLFFHHNRLQLVNNVDLEDYIAGVVEAEVGRLAPKEYLKLQSIICRTYALGHMHKHYLDGYNLCNEVHCQAYKGKTFYGEIQTAVYKTKDIVLVDSDISLISAVFHSSCGGQTVNSEDVWTEPMYYLRSVTDSFCINGKNAHWEKVVKADAWEKYLRKELSLEKIDDEIYDQSEPERKVFYIADKDLRMEKIRNDWHLRSTFFTTEKIGDEVIIKGKGFGHGVGLCQIGAMEMAKRGYTYAEILHHYYQGVHLVNLSAIDFFKDSP